jgi:hypothetical protein
MARPSLFYGCTAVSADRDGRNLHHPRLRRRGCCRRLRSGASLHCRCTVEADDGEGEDEKKYGQAMLD